MQHFLWRICEGNALPLVAAFAIVVSAGAHGQTPIRIQSVATPAQTLSINDVDFVHSTTPKWIFTISLTTQDPDPVSVGMSLKMNAHLATGEDLLAIVVLTDSFAINGLRTITNLDLRNPSPKRTYTVDESHKKRLEEIALPSGLLPAGLYTFSVEVTPTDGRGLSRDQFQIELINPSSVELLSPYDQDDFVNEFPLFQWRGDAPKWRLSIYQRLPGQASREETASGVPYFTATTTTQSLQYPGSGSRLLQSGHTYVWFVEGIISSSGGTQQMLKSALSQFTLAGRDAGSTPENTATFLDELERSLGTKYKGLIDQIRSQGLSSGPMLLNGSPISPAEVLNVLSQLRENPDAVTSVVLE